MELLISNSTFLNLFVDEITSDFFLYIFLLLVFILLFFHGINCTFQRFRCPKRWAPPVYIRSLILSEPNTKKENQITVEKVYQLQLICKSQKLRYFFHTSCRNILWYVISPVLHVLIYIQIVHFLSQKHPLSLRSVSPSRWLMIDTSFI